MELRPRPRLRYAQWSWRHRRRPDRTVENHLNASIKMVPIRNKTMLMDVAQGQLLSFLPEKTCLISRSRTLT